MHKSRKSEHERRLLLREAIDSEFINDDMFKNYSNKPQLEEHNPKNEQEQESNKHLPNENNKKLKSQRYLDDDGSTSNGDFKVTDSMQKYVAKKLSEIIDDKIEFVNNTEEDDDKHRLEKQNSTATSKINYPNLKLLNNTEPITNFDEYDLKLESNTNQLHRQFKRQFKRRIIESDDDNITHEQKCKLASITLDQIKTEQNQLKLLKNSNRKLKKIFHYKERNGIFYFVEPENEFTKLRIKNNWNENKIATARHNFK